MTIMATVFMAMSWAFVLGLAVWSYRRVLRASRSRNNADGGGR